MLIKTERMSLSICVCDVGSTVARFRDSQTIWCEPFWSCDKLVTVDWGPLKSCQHILEKPGHYWQAADDDSNSNLDVGEKFQHNRYPAYVMDFAH